MLSALIFIVVAAVVIYASTNNNVPVSSTASAIVEIWSGNCGRACQYSENAMLTDDQSRELNYRGAGPSSGCICGTCPCLLIDNMLTTVSPAMICYCHFISHLSDLILLFAAMLNEILEQAARVLECRRSCKLEEQSHILHPIEITTHSEERPMKRELPKVLENTLRNKLSPLSLVKKNKEEAAGGPDREATGTESKLKTESKSILKSEPTARFKREQETTDTLAVAGTSTEPPKEGELSNSSQIDEADSSTTQVEGVCKKCIERGKICVGLCPRAKIPETIDRSTETKQENRKRKSETTITEQKTKPEVKDEFKITQTEATCKLNRESRTQFKQDSKTTGLKVPVPGTSSMPKQDEATRMAGIEEVESSIEEQGPCRKCIMKGKTCEGSCPKTRTTDKSTE